MQPAPSTRFLDRFGVILLDLNGTFMFGMDRFGPGEDYHATYRALGGDRLSRNAVMTIMADCCVGVLRDYDTPARFEDFPSIAEAFREYGKAEEEDLELLERVFASHELGQVPSTYVECLRRLAATHHLGLVSNICARPAPWVEYLERIGVLELFGCMVFSSAGRTIKPSLDLFRRARATFPADAPTLFVGDSLERDIVPARALGMGTAWIAPDGASADAADVVVPSLLELEHASLVRHP